MKLFRAALINHKMSPGKLMSKV